ncbi:MAG: GNAT family N-acetyltransferase [Calditrichae bacterium]|nr:GNAT family N-acetyltransferase [Calditrichota bacterium]MCB9059629.1 GNAT family N-acetyltransferase [Calditrichia bacterium]
MEFINDAFLIGSKIYLRAFQSGDEEMISRLENHPDPRSTLFYAFPVTTEQIHQKTSRYLSDPNTIIFTICNTEQDSAVGQVALFRIDWVGRMATFYIGIADKSNWSKGYGSEATMLLLRYAFDTLNLNRVQLHVAVENEAAVKVYKKCGFVQEGTLRQAMFHDGHYSDFYIMGILKHEFKK